MKYLLSILFMLFVVTANSQKTTPSSLGKDIKDAASSVVDSTKKVAKEAVTFVDTSSNLKMVYQDAKDGIIGLAKALKVTAEHVYIVLVKQQIANAIAYSLLFVLAIISIIICYKQWGKIEMIPIRHGGSTEPKEVRPLVFTVVFFSIAIVSFLVAIFHLDVIIMGFVNPEYGAIQDIMNFVNIARQSIGK